ncbi:hypothetical protein GCM10007216_09950 [Thalassobacillus devorans]|uniref:DUF4352 domain-containing protein n=1 Tax=Thalassobacillus devorans TaxID=279813 RepID=A0ABQ1NSB2_9BACI|nr:hypothetical protein [Thalassobacillus devorans]NIK29066.1 hypothetical protein [Thalassobacillus devorans]GGC81423.1 hypothetical protein GCM10007216_09950 [Thalassobacillus devorans]
MNSFFQTFYIVAILLLLSACNADEEVERTEDNNNNTTEMNEDTQEENSHSSREETKAEAADDQWTYYEDVKASEEFEEVSYTIKDIGVSDDAPMINDEGERVSTSVLGMTVKVENNSGSNAYSTNIDEAILITSTGEKVEADEIFSDDLGGDLHEEEKKEGQLIFYPENGKAADIEWIELNWKSSIVENENSSEDYDHRVKIELK